MRAERNVVSESKIQTIKEIALKAIVSDDELMDVLILKGGNALDIIHKMSGRGSTDLDFSSKKLYDKEEFERISKRINELLIIKFEENGFEIVDFEFENYRENMEEPLKQFWGGYSFAFKIIETSKFERLSGNIKYVRRNTIPLDKAHKKSMRIEISPIEFCPDPERHELDDFEVNVYSTTLIAIEKLRAICQQMKEYASMVSSIHPRARARDFFDIHLILTVTGADLTSETNLGLIKQVFHVKRVPIEFLKNLEEYRDFHKGDYNQLRDTLKPGTTLLDFDVYFDFVKLLSEKITNLLDKKVSIA